MCCFYVGRGYVLLLLGMTGLINKKIHFHVRDLGPGPLKKEIL